jgi:hypothetical protein
MLRRYGLFPVASTGLGGGGFYVDVAGERLPLRGGFWNNAAASGVFASPDDRAGEGARVAQAERSGLIGLYYAKFIVKSHGNFIISQWGQFHIIYWIIS